MEITLKEYQILLFMRSMTRNLTPFDTVFLNTIKNKKSLSKVCYNFKKKELIDTDYTRIDGLPVFIGWVLTEKGKDKFLFENKGNPL